jgi:hypothetical protein
MKAVEFGASCCSASGWLTLPGPQPTYLDHLGLAGASIYARELGDPGIGLVRTGSRLRRPVIRYGLLWVCQHIGLAGTTGTYGGDQTGSTEDRSAVQWLELQLNSTSSPLTHVAHGRTYDATASSPYYYYMPSLMVNFNGDMTIAFSGSKSTEYIGAFYVGRLANGTISGNPILVQAGWVTYAGPYWGDYSYTCLDPVDGTTIWTVQEYTQGPGGGDWGTWATQIKH